MVPLEIISCLYILTEKAATVTQTLRWIFFCSKVFLLPFASLACDRILFSFLWLLQASMSPPTRMRFQTTKHSSWNLIRPLNDGTFAQCRIDTGPWKQPAVSKLLEINGEWKEQIVWYCHYRYHFVIDDGFVLPSDENSGDQPSITQVQVSSRQEYFWSRSGKWIMNSYSEWT